MYGSVHGSVAEGKWPELVYMSVCGSVHGSVFGSVYGSVYGSVGACMGACIGAYFCSSLRL